MTTMHEKYGDGSDHVVCEKCGLCITCGDCAKNGCGKKNKVKLAGIVKIRKRLAKFQKDGSENGWSRDVAVLLTEIDRLGLENLRLKIQLADADEDDLPF